MKMLPLFEDTNNQHTIFFNEAIDKNTLHLENEWLPVLVEHDYISDTVIFLYRCFPHSLWRFNIKFLVQKNINFLL